MKFDDVSFNVERIKKFKTAQDFSKALEYQHLWPKVSLSVRKQRLEELFNLVNKKNANGKRLSRSSSKD